jgi:hypothetical protein
MTKASRLVFKGMSCPLIPRPPFKTRGGGAYCSSTPYLAITISTSKEGRNGERGVDGSIGICCLRMSQVVEPRHPLLSALTYVLVSLPKEAVHVHPRGQQSEASHFVTTCFKASSKPLYHRERPSHRCQIFPIIRPLITPLLHTKNPIFKSFTGK